MKLLFDKDKDFFTNYRIITFEPSAFQGENTLKYELNTQLQKAEVKRPSAAEGIFFL
jgi:hypothetical protein